MIDFTQDNDFSFWLPLEIEKAENKKESGERIIRGIASTPDEDLQKELVDQAGIDFSYFLRYGYYNNDHKPGFANKVGQPTECKVVREGLWTRGFLFKNHKIADDIWELACALEASKANRKLGFSIQGKVIRRNGNRIRKCWVQDIAITTAPINTNTWMDIVKSLAAVPKELWDDGTDSYEISPRLVSPIAKSTCEKCIKEMNKKAFSDGLSLNEQEMDLKKKTEEKDNDDEKSLSTSSGSPLQVQSLEGKIKDQGWAHVMNKSLSFEECVTLIQNYRHLSLPESEVVAEAVFAMNGLIL